MPTVRLLFLQVGNERVSFFHKYTKQVYHPHHLPLSHVKFILKDTFTVSALNSKELGTQPFDLVELVGYLGCGGKEEGLATEVYRGRINIHTLLPFSSLSPKSFFPKRTPLTSVDVHIRSWACDFLASVLSKLPSAFPMQSSECVLREE